jgi:general secretion pathway protein G
MLLHTDGLPMKCHLVGRKLKRSWGFTVTEMLIAVCIAATLAAIAIPVVTHYIDQAAITRTISEIRMLQNEIKYYYSKDEVYPNTLNDIERGTLLDAWGNPYQYLRITGAKKEKPRKDRFLVPVNSDFDLYSMGKDGDSQPAFTASVSRDDIVRANDGEYIGLASEF